MEAFKEVSVPASRVLGIYQDAKASVDAALPALEAAVEGERLRGLARIEHTTARREKATQEHEAKVKEYKEKKAAWENRWFPKGEPPSYPILDYAMIDFGSHYSWLDYIKSTMLVETRHEIDAMLQACKEAESLVLDQRQLARMVAFEDGRAMEHFFRVMLGDELARQPASE